MPAAQTESKTTDSGGIHGKHNEGSLSGMHMESCFGRGASKPQPIKIWVVKDDLAKSLCAVLLPKDVPLAPVEVLKTIQCTCSSDQPCSSLRCGCASGQLPCSLFYKCGGSDRCCNRMTKNNMANDANDDEEHSDDEDYGDEDDD